MASNQSHLAQIAEDYRRCHRGRARRELEHFRHLRTDEDAVTEAALAKLPSGKRHPHQYRTPRVALEESRRRLLGNLPGIKRAQSFDDLFALVEQVSGSIPRIGPLTVYDTALRIGARFGLEPTSVYLHSGTRDGAKTLLGTDGRRETIELDELPPPLGALSAREVEDLLCIYKDGFDDSQSGCVPAEPRGRRRTC